MSRRDDRLNPDQITKDLDHIADRAAPSSTAWEAIQSRIAAQPTHSETEIVMLQPDDPRKGLGRARMAGAAVAAVVLAAGLYFVLRSDADDQSVRVVDSTEAPASTVPGTTAPVSTTAPATTTTADLVTTTSSTTTTEVVDTTSLGIVLDFFAARNAWDGEAVLALVADGAAINDEMQSRPDGGGTPPPFDFAVRADYERAVGFQYTNLDCSLSSPGRVRCTFDWENAWSVAVGDSRYVGSSMIIDVADGQITGLNTNLKGPDLLQDPSAPDPAGQHIFQQFQVWVAENHPEIDILTMFDSIHIPLPTADNVALWEELTLEFVAR